MGGSNGMDPGEQMEIREGWGKCLSGSWSLVSSVTDAQRPEESL